MEKVDKSEQNNSAINKIREYRLWYWRQPLCCSLPRFLCRTNDKGWKLGHRPVNLVLDDFPSTLAVSVITQAEHWSQKEHQDDND